VWGGGGPVLCGEGEVVGVTLGDGSGVGGQKSLGRKPGTSRWGGGGWGVTS